MSRRLVFILAVLVPLCVAPSGFARVSGLPDFTELVEEAVPAVGNIRVTQFGDRVTPGTENPHDPEQMPECIVGHG